MRLSKLFAQINPSSPKTIAPGVTSSSFWEHGPNHSNQFYIYNHSDAEPWDIYESNPDDGGFARYFGAALRLVDCQVKGMTFYVTTSKVDHLPSYGKNVVVLLLGDERYQLPSYSHRVGAIFKCYGNHQIRYQIKDWFTSQPTSLKFLLACQSAKNLTYRLPRWINYQTQNLGAQLFNGSPAPAFYNLPLGYLNSEDLPLYPFEYRHYDVFFGGSISSKPYSSWSIQRWLMPPKIYARSAMLKALESVQAQHPHLKIQTKTTERFFSAQDFAEGQPNRYSQSMMQTKICCAPRGTSIETYRLYEAMRYGCIIISEPLPPHWFYQGAPILQVANWTELNTLLPRLLSNPELMLKLHQQTLDWWQKKCSEVACGQYIVDQLKTLLLEQQCQSQLFEQ